MSKKNNNRTRNSALKFIFLMGFVSLFSDMTYEGARSITGPFLAFLGANALVVGFVSGLGEFIGYALRIFSGLISDKTKQYWAFTILGYVINLLAVPLLAFAGSWEIAAALLIIERTGKALRSPARDAILSHATKQVGTGWGFGLHEALDQIGAVTGPLLIALVFFFKHPQNYSTAFLTLGIPALVALSILAVARFLFPNPRKFETKKQDFAGKGLNNKFWLYLAAVSLVAAGYADFPLVAFHIKRTALVTDNWIPVLYSLAMGIDAIAALVFGRLFDKKGLSILALAIGCSAFFAPLAFLGNMTLATVGIMLWGIGMGAQESIMRSAVAELIPSAKRGTAYGIFNSIFGLFWFLGSALMGFLYNLHIFYLVVFSLLIQIASIPLLLAIKNK